MSKKLNNAQKQKYLLEEIRAVENVQNASGWYVWSANNAYDNLFQVLKNNKTKFARNPIVKVTKDAYFTEVYKQNSLFCSIKPRYGSMEIVYAILPQFCKYNYSTFLH